MHSQAEHDAIGQLIGPTAQNAFLGAERLDDKSWRWRDGTPWGFETWEPGQPDNADDQAFLAIASTPNLIARCGHPATAWYVIAGAAPPLYARFAKRCGHSVYKTVYATEHPGLAR